SVHQKQPPAKVAISVLGAVFGVSAPPAAPERTAASAAITRRVMSAPQRRPVVAVAQSGRRRAVVEHVALVAAAARAVVLGARPEELEILFRGDVAGDRIEEARPAGAAVVLLVGVEQRQVAGRADEGARTLLVVQRAGAGAL